MPCVMRYWKSVTTFFEYRKRSNGLSIVQTIHRSYEVG